jgi:Domain of unknown function (DUF4333)
VPPVSGRGAALVGVVLALFVAACSSDGTTIDAGELERDLRSELERSNRVSSVRCPEGVKLEKGAKFTCTAKVEGARKVIDVELRTDEDLYFNVRP